MKRILAYICLFIVCMSIPSYGQTDKLIQELSDIKGVSSVLISESMLKLIGGGTDLINNDELKLDKVLPKLNGIQILSADSGKAVEQLRTKLADYIKKQKLEMLMQTKDDDEVTRIYFMESKDFKKEFSRLILVVDDKEEVTFIGLSGTFKLDDLKEMIEN